MVNTGSCQGGGGGAGGSGSTGLAHGGFLVQAPMQVKPGDGTLPCLHRHANGMDTSSLLKGEKKSDEPPELVLGLLLVRGGGA